MAASAVLISNSSSSTNLSKDSKAEPDNQWSAILNDVRASASNRLTEKNLLVLGDRECGKSSLLGRLIGKDSMIPSGVGLEHVCIPVKDDDREDSTQVNAYVLEEEEFGSQLLPLALNGTTFDTTLVWIVVSMSKPWNIIKSLDKWAGILSSAIDRAKIDPVIMKQHYAKMEKLFKDYIDPSVAKISAVGSKNEVDLPLGENTLTNNLGIPIIVVVTKADYLAVLEKDMDYKEEKFDFLQLHLRNWCLKHGASLIFTSAKDKENKNVNILYRYTAHLMYGLRFEEDFVLDPADSVFIPIGWDNEKKISILNDGLGELRPTESFENVISAPPPLVKQNAGDLVSQAEEDQDFVKRIQQILQQPVPSRMESPASMKQNVDRRPSPAQGSPKKSEGPRGSLGAGGPSESALSTFFNTLLNKNTANKSGSPSASPASARQTSPGPSATRLDPAAELDRLSRGRQSLTPEREPDPNKSIQEPSSENQDSSEA